MTLSISLRHRFPGFSIDLDIESPAGVTVLFGPSGTGKSTILNAVAGLLRPDDCRIAVDGMVMTDTAAGVFVSPHRRRMGMIFQDGRLFPHLTVRQNLRYGRWFAPRAGARASETAIVEMLGIGALLERAPATLSGGERQRVAIGRALMAQPRLMLADEPLSALDDARKAEILPYLERMRDDLRIPMLYVSHVPAEVARIATTVVLLDAGRVSRIGPAADVLSDPSFAGRGRDAGAVFEAVVVAHHDDGLSELSAGGASLFVPRVPAPPGSTLRMRIAAADVMLARGHPQGLSALNVLNGTVETVVLADDAVVVRLMTAAGPILSRITRRSARDLDVRPGVVLSAIIKSLSHGPEDIGTPTRR